MAAAVSNGFHVGGEVTGILLAGVVLGAFGDCPARVLPSLAFVVPMETKLRKCRGDFGGCLSVN